MNFWHLRVQEYLLTDIDIIPDEICTKNFSFIDQQNTLLRDVYERLELGECPCFVTERISRGSHTTEVGVQSQVAAFMKYCR
jgi:hypothetical protein